MIRVARVRDVLLPRRAHSDDAGIDFFMPKIDASFVHDLMVLEPNIFPSPRPGEDHLWMPPRSQALIPSGIIYEIPEKTALVQFDRSSLATKHLLKVLACVGDGGYQGELHLSVFNLSDRGVFLRVGSPIVQFLLLPICLDDIVEYPALDIFTRSSTRGSNGFGSSDTLERAEV